MSNNAKLSGAEFFRKYTDIMTESISEDLTDNKKYFSILLHVTIDTQGQEVDSFTYFTYFTSYYILIVLNTTTRISYRDLPKCIT
jgi:hypothetical protein